MSQTDLMDFFTIGVTSAEAADSTSLGGGTSCSPQLPASTQEALESTQTYSRCTAADSSSSSRFPDTDLDFQKPAKPSSKLHSGSNAASDFKEPRKPGSKPHSRSNAANESSSEKKKGFNGGSVTKGSSSADNGSESIATAASVSSDESGSKDVAVGFTGNSRSFCVGSGLDPASCCASSDASCITRQGREASVGVSDDCAEDGGIEGLDGCDLDSFINFED